MRKITLAHINPLDPTFQRNMCGLDFDLLTGQSTALEVNSPDECPNCHYGIDLSEKAYINYHDIYSDEQKQFNIISIHICPHCHRGFVIEHHMNVSKNSIKEKSQSVYPTTVPDLRIDEDIKQISPEFYEIYKQCLIAKNDGLTQIYGMGFRKALEKLVTDFAIKQNNDDTEKILNMSLHNRIETYFKDSDAKTALMACKWLGNNETHYENCNDEQDLQLFEDLIEDTLYYIHREIRHEKAEHINNTKGQK